LTWPYLTSIFRRGIKQLGRQKATRTAATLTMAVALALAGVAWGLHSELDRLAQLMAQSLKLIVYLGPAAEDGGQELAARISTWPHVTGVSLVSSQEAKARLERVLEDKAGLLEGLDEEVIPPLIEVELDREGTRTENLAPLRERLEALPGVDEAAFPEESSAVIRALIRRLRGLGRGLASALILGEMFIVFATIRLVFLAHLEEIRILKLIGATAWFIRGPYLVQGAGQGLIAAVVSLVLVFGVQGWLDVGLEPSPGLGPAGRLIPLKLLDLSLCLKLLLAGTLSGVLGAWLALSRVMAER
jgi:cell division transport system permease protein